MSNARTSQETAADPLSVEALSRRFSAVLVRYFARRGIAHADAQDLAQEALARLVRREGVAAIERADAYLFTIAANLVTEFHRYHAIRKTNPPEGYLDAIHRCAEFTPERLLEAKQELQLVITALHQMPERMRHVFALARLENIPRAEIAARLGVAKRTVEQDLTTATAWLIDVRRRSS